MSDETQAIDTEPEAPALLDLGAPRVFTLKGKKGNYTITCRRVTPEDWAAYFNAIYVTTQQDGKDVVRSVDVESARLLLAERVIVKAEGYKLASVQEGELQSLPGWQRLLPLAHRFVIGNLLSSAFPVQPADDEEIIFPEGQPVELNAAWNSDAAGNLKVFKGLVHVLKSPTEAQHRRYARAASLTRVMGGSRAGTTQYMGAQTVAAQLYDELVVSVEGYSVHGEFLRGLEAIRREMDMHHKFMAAIQVLQPPANALAKSDDDGDGDGSEEEGDEAE